MLVNFFMELGQKIVISTKMEFEEFILKVGHFFGLTLELAQKNE